MASFHYDVIIIGSGMGGSVAAKRFCDGVLPSIGGSPVVTHSGTVEGTLGKVAVFEMGERWHGWNSSTLSYEANTGQFSGLGKLEQSQKMRYLMKLFRDYPYNFVESNPGLVVAQGMGWGGGSLVYSGIHLRAPSSALANWPTGYQTGLAPYYQRVESKLKVATDANTFNYRRPAAFKKGAALAGLGTAQPMPLAMSGCTHCGWCVPACITDKKQSMPLNYLGDAKRSGKMTPYLKYKCTDVEPLAGGGYRVWMLYTGNRPDAYHEQTADGDPYWDGTWYGMTARRVVIAGGAMESPCILQRSKGEWNMYIGTGCGTGVDGQGDGAVIGIAPPSYTTDTYKGAIMMSYVDKGDYVLEDIHGIPAGIAKFPIQVSSGGQWKQLGLGFKQKLASYGSRMLGVAIIGKSPSGGNITVGDANSTYKSIVSTGGFTLPTGAKAAAESLITSLGGELTSAPATSVTVHPTGGCKMGTSSSSSVVDKRNLQVWGNPGLYVMDGSVFPWSSYRNPSNTILACVEKACDVIFGPDPGW